MEIGTLGIRRCVVERGDFPRIGFHDPARAIAQRQPQRQAVGLRDRSEGRVRTERQDRLLLGVAGCVADPGPVARIVFDVVVVLDVQQLAGRRGQAQVAVGDRAQRVCLAELRAMPGVGAIAAHVVGRHRRRVRRDREAWRRNAWRARRKHRRRWARRPWQWCPPPLRWRPGASCCMPRRQAAPTQDIRTGREQTCSFPWGGPDGKHHGAAPPIGNESSAWTARFRA